MSANSDNPKVKTTAELFFEQLELLRLKHEEAEARKSPEQKAAESRQRKELEIRYTREKQEKKHQKLLRLYGKWCKRDTWLLRDQALPLFSGKDPSELTVFDDLPIKEIRELAISCAGHSLHVINLKDKISSWLVTPHEWVRWLQEKGYAVPSELLTTLFPPTPIRSPQQKIQPAQQAREIQKRDRIKALKAFISSVSEIARKKGVAFDSQSIPVTKADFLAAFYAQYPHIKKILPTTFDHDIAEINIKFKHGTKSNKNNLVAQLFS